MAFPRHWLLAFGGTLGDRDEWVCGIRMRIADGFFPTPAGVDEDAALESYAGPIQTWFSSGDMLLSQGAALTFFKLNEIGPDGKYADKTITHRLDLADPARGSSGNGTPLDLAMCVTTTTDAQRGKASKGRFYVPMPCQNISLQGVWQQDAVDNAVNATAQMLQALAPSDVTGGLEPAVVSPGIRGDQEGGSRRISGVRIGDQPDRQRRRREGTPERYRSAVILT